MRQTDLIRKESCVGVNNDESTKVIDFYYSFRSPYSQLAVRRLRSICSKYSAVLRLKPVMPMVLRGLEAELHLEKRIYLVTDTAREARIMKGGPQLFGSDFLPTV